jgi:hypothetical protein
LSASITRITSKISAAIATSPENQLQQPVEAAKRREDVVEVIDDRIQLPLEDLGDAAPRWYRITGFARARCFWPGCAREQWCWRTVATMPTSTKSTPQNFMFSAT